MDLPYREYYNKEVLPVSPTGFESMEALFQVSKDEIFHVTYDTENGLSQSVIRFVDSKTKIMESYDRQAMEKLNMGSRYDLLHFFITWSKHDRQTLDDGEVSRMLVDMVPLCQHYNNVIMFDGICKMGFSDLKDFSKRTLRSRRTGRWEPRYYDPEGAEVLEARLGHDESRLAELKQDLMRAIEEERPDEIGRLSMRVTDLMRRVHADRIRMVELREVMGCLGTGQSLHA